MKINNVLYVFFVLVFCCFLTSCGALTHGTSQKVVISTSPAGATVSDGVREYKTPATIELQRSREYTLTISKSGFVTEKVKMKREINSMVAKDILLPFVGFIAWGIDAASGAQWSFVPEKVALTLKPIYAVQLNKESVKECPSKKDDKNQ